MSKIHDNREPYYRDADGRIFALKCCGDNGDVAQHEDVSHDENIPERTFIQKLLGWDGETGAVGWPHQNPAVVTKNVGFFARREAQENYYPFTIRPSDGEHVDLVELQRRVDAYNSRKQRSNRKMEITVLSPDLELKVNRVENQQQLNRGVKQSDLKFKLNGKPKQRWFKW